MRPFRGGSLIIANRSATLGRSRVCVTFSTRKAAMNLFAELFRPDRSSRNAVLFEGREITYADLRDETVRAAEVLHALGVQPGDRVALLLSDSPEFIASFVAIVSL